MKTKIKFVVLPVVVITAAILIWHYLSSKNNSENMQSYKTARITTQNLVKSINATGTVEPEELVNVGAQVQGMITEFGKDVKGRQIDYGSVVKSGQMLAKIDDAIYDAAAKEAYAQLLQSDAAIKNAEAQILQAKAKTRLAKLELERAEKLLPSKAISQSSLDTAKLTYESTLAAQNVAEAGLAQAVAQKAAADANYARCNKNLEYCTIKSPVDGVIIDRRVNIGQTVVSSMSAPSLFLLAKDLKRMQIWVSVNEADVGLIKVGQRVLFTVDTFKDDKFEGTVGKIRLNATMSQNVVTYVVEVFTDNSNEKLLPYLTANVKFIIDERQEVMCVPNAAFRFTPDQNEVPEEYRNLTLDTEAGEKLLWTLENQQLKPLKIKTGLNNGSETEVILITQTDAKNLPVVIGRQSTELSATKDAAGTSPFMPTPPHRVRSNTGGKK